MRKLLLVLLVFAMKSAFAITPTCNYGQVMSMPGCWIQIPPDSMANVEFNGSTTNPTVTFQNGANLGYTFFSNTSYHSIDVIKAWHSQLLTAKSTSSRMWVYIITPASGTYYGGGVWRFADLVLE